jgi:hypothetical protein
VSNESAARIIELCKQSFPSNSGDCNKFLKAVANLLFEPASFAPGADADAIVATLRASADWTKLGTSHADAIRDAKNGLFVVAGMTSDELASDHGHLAVVVGDEGQESGTVTVPICYAGSLNALARAERKRVSVTFGTGPARESRISYFSRRPNA